MTETATIDIPGSDDVAHRLEPFGVLVNAPEPDRPMEAIPLDWLMALARTEHLVLVRGHRRFPDAESLAEYSRSWGDLLMWPFGPVLELHEKPAATDHIFGHCSVPMHWDGMYRGFVPEFQIFSCVAAPGASAGGRTLFTDTTRVLAEASAADRATWAATTVTYEIDKVSHYGGRVSSPLLAQNPVSGAAVIRYNEPPPVGEHFPNPHQLTFHGVREDLAAEVASGLRARLHNPRYRYAHEWRTGDLVIADNYTLLHGREAFLSGEARHLRRVHVLGRPPLENPAIDEAV